MSEDKNKIDYNNRLINKKVEDFFSLSGGREYDSTILSKEERAELEEEILTASIAILEEIYDAPYPSKDDPNREEKLKKYEYLTSNNGPKKNTEEFNKYFYEQLKEKLELDNYDVTNVKQSQKLNAITRDIHSVLNNKINTPITKNESISDYALEINKNFKNVKDGLNQSTNIKNIEGNKVITNAYRNVSDEAALAIRLGASPTGNFSQEQLKAFKDDPDIGKHINSEVIKSTGETYYWFGEHEGNQEFEGTKYMYSGAKFVPNLIIDNENFTGPTGGSNIKEMTKDGHPSKPTGSPQSGKKPKLLTNLLVISNLYDDMKVEEPTPQVGDYFKTLGPNRDDTGKNATVYYYGENGTEAFSNIAELQIHMKQNHPELLKDVNLIKEGEPASTYSEVMDANKTFLADNFVDLAIKDFDLENFEQKDKDALNSIYESKVNPETITGVSSITGGYLDQGEYVSEDYNPKGDESGYTGKAKKVKKTGVLFNAKDPKTFTWQYEKVNEDGTTYYETAPIGDFEVDENAYKKFEETLTNPPPDNKKSKQNSDAEKDKKMGEELGSVITALKAGAGIIGLGKAMKDIPIGENQELSDSFKAYMQKSKELSESGLTAAEKSSIRNDLSNAYSLGAKNVLRASGGNRGTFLSNMGMLNTNRVNSLIKMGEIDAKMQRQNMANYGNMLTFQEKFKADQGAIGREMAYKESLRKSNLYGGLGSSLIGSAISDLTYAEQMKNMEPYMNEWARNMGLIKTSTDTEGDAADDANLSVNTGT